jgi:lipopolysaccharide export system protein LptC
MRDRPGVNCLTIASQTEGSGGFLMPPRRDHRRAFRAAMRHSRLVRIIRVGLPVAIVVFAVAFGAYRWLDPMRALARLPVGTDGVVVQGTKVVMRQPRLTGYTKDERPYTLTARSAAKDLTNPDVVEMEEIRTTIQMPDGRDVEVTSREGLYETKAETIRLSNGVVVKSPEYDVLMKEALVNVRAGTVVSELPVEVKMLQGTIHANRMEVAESGAVIRFEGGVTVDIDGDAAPTITGSVVP